jgi:hypothetical protein
MPVDKQGTTKRVAGAKVEYSKISQFLFKRIIDYLPDPENANFATHKVKLPSGEWEIKPEFKLRNKYFDFKYKNNLIEFSSNYWHADPRLYSPNAIVKGRTAQSIWDGDSKKSEIAKEEGFRLLVIWEDSYTKSPESVVEMCVNFILENQKVGD